MHLGTHALLEFFRARRRDDSLVLATVIATSGSTYRKPGAMMLIARDGAYEGMVSGGCLEGDLLHHAAGVFESGRPAHVTYDMHADEELVWSLGLGCDGVIHLLLQRLDRESEFAFLDRLDAWHGERRDLRLALVTQGAADLETGSYGLVSNDISIGNQKLVDILSDLAELPPSWRTRHFRLGESGETEVLAIHVPPRPRVLICGAGPDAVPVARALSGLDWEVWVADHRPAYARPDRFPSGCSVLQVRPENLGAALDPAGLDAAVIMSHHLENDSRYLEQLAPADLPYIGVLGPRTRRDRLLQMAACPGRTVFGPVGLDIGAELPAAIALAVAAEIHAVLNERDGAPLTRRADQEKLEGADRDRGLHERTA